MDLCLSPCGPVQSLPDCSMSTEGIAKLKRTPCLHAMAQLRNPTHFGVKSHVPSRHRLMGWISITRLGIWNISMGWYWKRRCIKCLSVTVLLIYRRGFYEATCLRKGCIIHLDFYFIPLQWSIRVQASVTCKKLALWATFESENTDDCINTSQWFLHGTAFT